VTVHYIDQTAPGGGSGTAASPYNSTASLPPLVAGDKVRLLSDYVGQLLYDSSKGDHGTSGNEIVFEGWGGVRTVRYTGWCIDINARNYVTVQNLRAGPTGSYADGGIRFLNCEHQKVQYCTTEDRCDYGIQINNTGSSALVGVEVLDNEVLGTFNNVGILVIWGSAEGGVYVDVEIKRNVVRSPGKHATTGSPSPYGIRLIPRATSLTTTAGTVDLDYFSCGVQVEDNEVYGTPAYGIAYAAIGSGHSATLVNRVAGNTLRDCGNGNYDSHMLWIAGCRDVVVEHNDLDGSTVFAGHSYGTGVGIFVDNYGFDDPYNNASNIDVRRNIIRNTGRNPETSSSDSLEVIGAAIGVFLSQGVRVIDNLAINCANGVSVIGWFGGSSGKTANVTARGNRVISPRYSCYSIIKAADAVTLQENWGQDYGDAGIYIENAGAYALTNYTETRNNIVGSANDAYMGGSEPTSTATPRAARTPGAGNLTVASKFRLAA
jgi:hypothetical protein